MILESPRAERINNRTSSWSWNQLHPGFVANNVYSDKTDDTSIPSLPTEPDL